MPSAARTSQPVGRLAPGTRLNLALGLPLRNRAALEQFLEQVYDPSSAAYRHYLTPEEFTLKFGPTGQDYQNAMEFARTNGLTITAVHPNRLVLDVSGSVVNIERAFGISMRLYQHPAEPRTFYAPDVDPSVPVSVPLLHVSGLDNYLIPHPADLGPVRPPGGGGTGPVPLAGAGPGGSYQGSDFRGAYARAVTLNGSGQMVGLLEFDGYYASDITTYRSQAGVANVPLLNVTMDGFDGTPGKQNVEVALDIEVVSAIAPGLSQIIVYEAGPPPNGLPDDVLNRMATDNLAKQLSGSWVYAVDPTTDQIFLEFAAQGQSYFNASGDTGAYVGSVSTPADNPYITVVGGTLLSTTGPGGAWLSETAWNRGGTSDAATGGGVSTTYRIPAWQKPVNMLLNQGSVTMRNLPDVAAVADNVYATYNNGSSEVLGGTSCSSPLWAGFLALVNQQAAAFGQPPVGFLNPTVYRLGLSAGYTTNFHDITTGNNTNSSSPTQFFATSGYDLCTGWGSPFGQNLINALAPRIPAVVLSNAGSAIVSEGCFPPNNVIDPGETVTVNFSLKDIGGFKSTNLTAALKADPAILPLSGPQNYGVLASGGAVVTRPFTFTALGNCGDIISPTLELHDGAATLGTARFNFQLGTPVIAFTENFDEATAPALPAAWTTVISNSVANWVTATTFADSAPNAAFADEPPVPGIEELSSPPIPIATASAQLTFRNRYNTEVDPNLAGSAFDGGMLEIQIGTNDFTDILSAGGSFAAGGYTRTIATGTNSDNPLAGRRVWAGNSGGFITSSVNLPAAAAGQTITLKWRFAVDTGNFYGGSGWYIDTISIKDGASCCSSSADLAVSQAASPEPVAPGQSLTYSVLVTNQGPSTASGVVVSNALPGEVIFSSASPGCIYSSAGYVLGQAGVLPAGSSTNFTITVVVAGSDLLTNLVAVSAMTFDPDSTNNTALVVSTIATNQPPIFYSQPADAVAIQGEAASFQATVFGVQPLAYQWLFNGTPIAGQTAAALALTNVQPDQIGAYSVVVANGNGAATSAPPAQLTVLPPPAFRLSSATLAQGVISISLQSATNLSYTLQYKNSLTDSNWTPILPAIPGTGGLLILQDTNVVTSPARFYQAVGQ